MDCFTDNTDAGSVGITAVTKGSLDDWRKTASPSAVAWIDGQEFTAAAASIAMLPGPDGALEGVLLGINDAEDPWAWGKAAKALPAGRYHIEESTKGVDLNKACLGWALGSYRFDRYKKCTSSVRELVWPEGADRTGVEAVASGAYLTRDLVNTPASDMGPGELASAASALAREFNGECAVTVGDDLLRDNFPMIHAVGRASTRHPRLIDLTWGNADAPKVTIVGKGVCFDSGGLDLKPSGGMLLMKKDMGGAAQALGLARAVMTVGLPVRLRVLIPAVENSVSGDAFRPLDILNSRKGFTVEIGNTDAEGRLVLADALSLAVEETPELLIDFATLTGAARVALGTDLPAMFANSDRLADDLLAGGLAAADPVWRLPLHAAYDKMLDSKIADINNAPKSGYGGAITAALFLKRFIPDDIPWAHFDLMSWNLSDKPGRPEGGEAQASRGVLEMLRRRYGG